MIDEEPDAAALFSGREQEIERPEDAQWPQWSGYIREAFEQLRDDRFYGAMGGLGRIYFTAISAYAEHREIVGSAFDDFVTFLRAVDDEYVLIQDERAKAEQDKQKT